MLKHGKLKNWQSTLIIAAVAAICLILNLDTFLKAYPLMFRTLTNPPVARDFSSYYIGAWRLLYAPGTVYFHGAIAGQYYIFPNPTSYKYTPSFLLFALPFLLVPYQTALVLFASIQFLLLPLMAFLVYKLLKGRNVLLVSVVMILVTLQPIWFHDFTGGSRFYYLVNLMFRPDIFSYSYLWQWAEGQAKVLETFLLLLSFYLANTKRPYLSSVAFGLALFDPRFFLLAIPLFLSYNLGSIRKCILGTGITILLANFLIFYQGIGTQFVSMAISDGIHTSFYIYGYIPLITILSLSVVNYRQIFALGSQFVYFVNRKPIRTTKIPSESI